MSIQESAIHDEIVVYICIYYLKSVNAEHIGTEALGSQGVADRGALVDDKDAGLLELLDMLTG